MMKTLVEQTQQMSEVKAAVTLVATGTGGSLLNSWATLEPYIDMVVKFGNVTLIFMGVYLAWTKIRHSDKEGDK